MVGRVAALLGHPLDPWQQHVADVAGELDDHGLPVFRTVVVHVPRQQGKSVLVLAELVAGMLTPGVAVGYMAQTGFDARNKVLDDWWPTVEGSRLGPRMKVRRSNGNTAIICPTTRSQLRVLPTTHNAARGQSLDLVAFDEAMAHRDREIWSGVSATTITRPHHQLWAVSNAGTNESVLLADLLGLARDDDGQARVALFDWHASPDDPPDSPAVWAQAMPAMAAGRVTPEVIAARYAEDTSPNKTNFRREYLNVWSSDIAERVIPAARWAEALDHNAAPTHPLSFAVEVAYLDQAAAVVAADPTGALEVVDHRPGTAWLPGRLAHLVARHQPVVVLADPKSPAGAHLEALARAGVYVQPVELADLFAAAVHFRDSLLAGRLHIRPHESLTAAANAARRRTIGDRWVLDRRDGGDASPLVAAALAHHHATTAARPAIY